MYIIYYFLNNDSSFFTFLSPITLDMRYLLISFFDIVYFLIIVFIFTTWILFQILLYSTSKPKKLYYDSFYFLNSKLVPYNNTFLEFVLTVVPIIIFILVFIPFLKVLGLESTFIKINNLNNLSLKSYFYSISIKDLDKLNRYKINLFLDKDSTKNLTIIKALKNQPYLIYEFFNNFTNYKNVYINSYFEDEVLFAYYSMDNFSNVDLSTSIENKINKYILSINYYTTVKSNNWTFFSITGNNNEEKDNKWNNTTIGAFLIVLLLYRLIF